MTTGLAGLIHSSQPTMAQLRKATGIYKRSWGGLPEPPDDFDTMDFDRMDFDTMRDFRRYDGIASSVWSPELHGEYRRALDEVAS
jgi:hypothetical protein